MIHFVGVIMALLVAFFITLGMTPIIKRVALALRIMDHPNQRKIHSQPIPLLGSVAVFMGVILSIQMVWWGGDFQEKGLIILFAGLFLLIVGVLDDWGILHPQVKLMVGMPIAGLILILFDLGLKIFPYNLLNYFFTLFWVVGITAAYNLLDGMDGLSTGVCVIASFFYFLIGLMTN